MLTLRFNQRLPTAVPDSLPIYATRPPAAAGTALESVARAWPSETTPTVRRVHQLGDWVAAEAGRLRLRYNRLSGAVEAAVRSVPGRVREGDKTFPLDDDRVVGIARAFVNRVKLIDDEASRLRVGTVTHLRRECAPEEDGAIVSEVLDAGVVFTRVIDEVPVVGPGGQVMVKVLPRGSVCGASRIFRGRGERVTMVRIAPPADALAELDRRLRRDPRLDGVVRVLRAQFGYFEAGRSESQRVFEPVYAFVFATEEAFPVKSAEVIRAARPTVA